MTTTTTTYLTLEIHSLTEKSVQSSVICSHFSGSSLQDTCGYLLVQASYNRVPPWRIYVSVNFPTAVRQAINGYQLVQASYGTVYACRYDGSKAFTVLFFRAGENSNFSTTEYYCTIEFASAAKLTKYSLRSPIKGSEVIFHMTRHEQAAV